MTLSKVRFIEAFLVALLVAAIGYGVYTSKSGNFTKSQKYQAVFLTNGQVYFGKITKRTVSVTTLADIYYLQVQQPIQPVSEQDKDKQQQTQIQLVKLGNELHKPKDEMVINNQQVLFTEEVQDDGQVGQAIARHKRGETDQSQTQTQTQSQTPSPTQKKE